MLKSKLDVREKAIDVAVEIMGVGTADKDVVSKAKEIEAYILGDADLPEVDTQDTAQSIIEGVASVIPLIASIDAKAPETPEAPAEETKE